MRSKIPSKRHRDDQATRLRYVPDAEYERRCRERRAPVMAHVPAGVTARLSQAGVLDRAEGTYRDGVKRHLVEAKLAEPVFVASEPFKLGRRVGDLAAYFRGNADAYTRAADALRRKNINAFPELEDVASTWAVYARQLWEGTSDLRPTVTFRKRKLNRLILELLAILRHTTNLSLTFAAREILPRILKVASDHHRAAPASLDAAWTRFRSIAATARKRGLLPDDLLYPFRLELFAGDDRFPVSLFSPHQKRSTSRRRS